VVDVAMLRRESTTSDRPLKCTRRGEVSGRGEADLGAPGGR